ncbi:MAG: DsbA family oxidoreductase [Opitutaceae bacterium]
MLPRMAVKITYFVEILSSWCHWAEPAWDAVKARFGSAVECEWKIALMNPAGFPESREQCDWFYRRSGTVVRSPCMLDSGWLEPELRGDYTAANLVAEAGRDFGVTDDRLRRALTVAALREGQKIGRLETAAEIGAKITGASASELAARATSAEVRKRVEISTAEFHAHQIAQRPSFILTSEIGDKAVISGLWVAGPLIAAAEAMLGDAAAYRSHKTRFGGP